MQNLNILHVLAPICTISSILAILAINQKLRILGFLEWATVNTVTADWNQHYLVLRIRIHAGSNPS